MHKGGLGGGYKGGGGGGQIFLFLSTFLKSFAYINDLNILLFFLRSTVDFTAIAELFVGRSGSFTSLLSLDEGWIARSAFEKNLFFLKHAVLISQSFHIQNL